ncbi:MAG TPA: hypothetical protein VGF25_19050 [Thermoleophilaceae bacterium]
MSRRGLTDAVTASAARLFPRSRRHDAHVVRDVARESIEAAGLRRLPREAVSMATAGLRARLRIASAELGGAPWGAALRALTLPLASALVVVWLFGFVPRYDHWPLGEGWALLLGGSLLAVAGAAFGSRWPVALGAAAGLAAAVAPFLGKGTEAALADTPSFFQGDGVDIAAASLAPTALLLVAAFALPAWPRRPLAAGLRRLALALGPAALALAVLLPAPEPEPTRVVTIRGSGLEPLVSAGPPYPFPWIAESRPLLAALGLALLASVVIAAPRARTRPAAALATGMVLATVAYPLAWAALNNTDRAPYWAHQSLGVTLVLSVPPLLLALALMRRSGRGRTPAPPR